MERFYEQSQKDTSVFTSDKITEILKTHSNFDFDEYNKDLNDINFNKLVKSLDMDKITSVWQIPKSQSGSVQAIQSNELKYGDVLGLGNVFGGQLLLKGMRSFFVQHPFNFDENKELLDLSPSQIKDRYEDIGFSKYKKLLTVPISFKLFSPNKMHQQASNTEAIKYLILINEVIGELMLNKVTVKNTQCKLQGFIKEKEDQVEKEFITQLVGHIQVLPLFKTQEYETTMVDVFEDENNELKATDKLNLDLPLKELFKQLQMREFDIVVCLDNCSTQKAGKELKVFTKLKIVNIISPIQKQSQMKRSTGLNLNNLTF